MRTESCALKNVLFLSSIAGQYVADEQPDEYGLTKACVQKLASQLAIKLVKQKIAVNTVVLGYVKQAKKTSRNDGFFNTGEYVVPSGTVLEPNEIADLMHRIIDLALSNRLFSGK